MIRLRYIVCFMQNNVCCKRRKFLCVSRHISRKLEVTQWLQLWHLHDEHNSLFNDIYSKDPIKYTTRKNIASQPTEQDISYNNTNYFY